MAKLPNILDKRPIIYDTKTPIDKVRATAKLFLENGFFNDAIDCFKKVEDIEELKKIKTELITMGDFFLAQKIDELMEPKDWQNLAQSAEKNNKLFFALRTYEFLEDEENQKKIADKISARDKTE